MPRIIETFLCGKHGQSYGKECRLRATGECLPLFDQPERLLPLKPTAA